MNISLHPIIIFFWGYILWVRVQCRGSLGILNESKLSDHKQLCFKKCGIGFQADDKKISSKELRERDQSCYKECLVTVRKRHLRSRLNTQKGSLDQHTETFFKREKREIASSQTEETSLFTPVDAEKCFIEQKGDNDPFFKPGFVNLTFEELNSSGTYEGEISWKPYSDETLNWKVNWKGYRIIYSVQNESRFGVKCQDLGRHLTSYTIPFKLQRGWEINVLLTLLPYSTGYDYSLSTCIVPESKHCIYSGGMKTESPSTVKVITAATTASSTSATRTSSTPTATKTSTSTPGNKKTITTIVGTAVSTAVLVCGIVVVCQVWRSHRRSQTDETLPPSDQDFEYDAFVIFSSKDTDWVKKTLIPTLEKKHGLKCCIHYRNFTPGVLFRDNVVESVYKCRKTVAVVSSHFFNSNYCGSELDFALHRLMEKRDDSLVVIKLDEVDKKNLPIELQERSYIDYSKSVERKEWETKLVNCLKKRNP